MIGEKKNLLYVQEIVCVRKKKFANSIGLKIIFETEMCTMDFQQE